MNFKRTMMDMWFRNTAIRRQTTQEYSMMINQFLSLTEMRKDRDLFSPTRRIHVQNIRGHDVEVLGIPFCEFREFGTDETEVAEFMHSGGTRLEALKFSLTRFVGFVVDDELFWHWFGRCWCLAVNEMDGETFWIGDGNNVASTGT